MKKDRLYIIIIILLMFFGLTLSSCYSVSRVGNCKYYIPKDLSSKYKAHKPINF